MNGLGHNTAAGRQLEQFLTQIENFKCEIVKINEIVKEVFAQAKSLGFEPKIMRELLKLRAMTGDERAEYEILLDIYKGAVGMLDGTPLGEYARKRLDGQDNDDPQTDLEDHISKADGKKGEKKSEEPADTVEDAKAKGALAATEGKRVIDNPYPAGNPCRAAWDEGWCSAAGTDGMEIPKAWQRNKKPKDDDQKGQEG